MGGDDTYLVSTIQAHIPLQQQVKKPLATQPDERTGVARRPGYFLFLQQYQ